MAKKYVTITTLTHTVSPGVAKTPTTAAKRPVTKDIGPGTVIVLDDDDQAQELIDLGAIRHAKAEDTKEVKAEKLDELTEDQLQSALIENARVNRELEAERVRRETEASTGLGETGNTNGGNKAPAKAAAKAPAGAAKAPAPAKAAAAGKPAASTKAAKDATANAGDDKNGDVGAAGQGGNDDGQGTNEGANTNADGNDNAGGTDDGGLV